jgi:hypothetical protein
MKITFFSALFLIVFTLKLAGIIDWGWFWVLLPLWAPPAVVLSFGIGYAIYQALK